MEPTSTDTLRALRPLAALLAPLLAPMVARELRANAGEDAGDPWLDQASSPLGRRAHCRLCKAGKIKGARKVGKRWLARRSALDAYVQAHGAPAPFEDAAPASGIREHDSDATDAALRAAGLVRTAPGGKARS